MMTVSLREVSPQYQSADCGAEELLFRLQIEQFEHDENYHREIARLSMHHRLTHMALHFAKYAGQLTEAGGDQQRIQKLTTDILIIALSCSNIVNIRLCDRVRPADDSAAANLIDLGSEIQESRSELAASTKALIRWTTIAAGRMAAACEKLDHIEDYSFRRAIEESVVSLAKGILMYASSCKWDLAVLVRARLQGVKQKSVLHGHV